MRITVEQARLLKSLQVVERAVNDRSAMPILANVLLETRQQELILTATDLDVGVQYRVPVMDKLEQGAITLPARRFSTIVRELPQEPVTIEAKKNHTATLVCGSTQFRLQGLPPEDFPIFPEFGQPTPSTIAQSTLKSLVALTEFAMSMEETRFVLNGALMTCQEGMLALVATDGRRLAVARAPLEPGGANAPVSVVVPAKTIHELGRLLQDDEDARVEIAPIKDNQLLFRFGETTIITRLIDGQFPRYEQVIPGPVDTKLTCSRPLLISAIRRASLMTTATSQAIVFEVAKDRVTISKESPEFGSAREDVPAAYSGSPMTLAFNPEFWLEALKALSVEEVSIELTSPEKPAVIRLGEDERAADGVALTYVVLPMKLS